eukprot:UN24067
MKFCISKFQTGSANKTHVSNFEKKIVFNSTDQKNSLSDELEKIFFANFKRHIGRFLTS